MNTLALVLVRCARVNAAVSVGERRCYSHPHLLALAARVALVRRETFARLVSSQLETERK